MKRDLNLKLISRPRLSLLSLTALALIFSITCSINLMGAVSDSAAKVDLPRSSSNFSLGLQYAHGSLSNYYLTSEKKLDKLGGAPRLSFEWIPLDTMGKLSLGIGVSLFGERDIEVAPNQYASILAAPLELLVTFRLDVIENQVIVPFGRFGTNVTLVKQSSKTGASKPATESSLGVSYGGGLELLLNEIDYDTARALKDSTGINKTYLVVEYIASEDLNVETTADLSYSAFLAGLRFEF